MRALVLAIACGWAGAAEHGAAPGDASPDGEPSYSEDHARVRTEIRQVLTGREFADLHADPDAFWRLVAEWINSIIKRVVSALRDLPEWAVWLIVGWMVLTLAAILGHLIYTLWTILGGTSRRLGAGFPGRGHPGELLGIRELSFDAVYAEAGRLLAAGDWGAATRYLYVAAILWLDRQGWIAFGPAKTNREYLSELRAQGRLQGPLGRLTDAFEAIVYGGLPATEAASREMANTVQGLLHEPARTSAN